jgi:rfaE bifunctional protein kinase chain/domain
VTIDQLLEESSRLRLLVLGDLMLDHWVWGTVSRISPEAPIPVVDVDRYSYTPGGASNVVTNLISLGARVSLSGIVGKDEPGRRLRGLLKRKGVDVSGVFVDAGRPTTLKSRIVAHGQQVVRADFEKRHPLAREVEQRVLDWVALQMVQFDAVLFSDYLKGFFTPGLVAGVSELCRHFGKPLIVGPKPANVPLYRTASLITLNAREAAEASGNSTATLEGVLEAGRRLSAQVDGIVVITRGEHGMSMFEPGCAPVHLPALATQVYDVSGAGDTVLASLGLGLAGGLACADALRLASHAAAVVVRKIGTATATPKEIRESLT